jgi:hypothetical protein
VFKIPKSECTVWVKNMSFVNILQGYSLIIMEHTFDISTSFQSECIV